MNIHQKLNAIFGEDRTIPDDEVRLAAAAPELLAALKDALITMKMLGCHGDAIGYIEQAIAKAEGK